MPLAKCPCQSEALSTPEPLVGQAVWDASPPAAAPLLHPSSALSADSEDSHVVEVRPGRGTHCAGDS